MINMKLFNLNLGIFSTYAISGNLSRDDYIER